MDLLCDCGVNLITSPGVITLYWVEFTTQTEKVTYICPRCERRWTFSRVRGHVKEIEYAQ